MNTEKASSKSERSNAGMAIGQAINTDNKTLWLLPAVMRPMTVEKLIKVCVK